MAVLAESLTENKGLAEIVNGFEIEIDLGPLITAALSGASSNGVRRIGNSVEKIYNNPGTPYNLIALANRELLSLGIWFDDPEHISRKIDLRGKVLNLTDPKGDTFSFDISPENTAVVDYRRMLGIDGVQPSCPYTATIRNKRIPSYR